jgi:hypothetical protein
MAGFILQGFEHRAGLAWLNTSSSITVEIGWTNTPACIVAIPYKGRRTLASTIEKCLIFWTNAVVVSKACFSRTFHTLVKKSPNVIKRPCEGCIEITRIQRYTVCIGYQIILMSSANFNKLRLSESKHRRTLIYPFSSSRCIVLIGSGIGQDCIHQCIKSRSFKAKFTIKITMLRKFILFEFFEITSDCFPAPASLIYCQEQRNLVIAADYQLITVTIP